MKESKDILTLFEALSNHEVFTPPRVAREMLDLLPQELWSDPSIRLLDPATKSGVFLREAFFRFFSHLPTTKHTGHDGHIYDLSDRQQRTNHILKNMLYGIAISELTGYLARRTLYGVMRADTDKQVALIESFSRSKNFREWCESEQMRFVSRNHYNDYYDHTLFCTPEYEGHEDEGNIFFPTDEVAARAIVDGMQIEDTYLPFIEEITTHAKINEIRNGEVKVDVIVGNPPYQISDGGHGRSAMPIYHHFVRQAKQLNPRYMTMIIPSRWFGGGKGMNEFRAEMLNDTRIRKIYDSQDAGNVFPGVDIAGGVCYFLWDRDNRGLCQVTAHSKAGTQTDVRKLNEFDILLRDGRSVSIVNKVLHACEPTMNNKVSSRKPFGIATSARPHDDGDIILRWQKGEGPFLRKMVRVGGWMIDKWKVITSYVSYDHGGNPDRDGRRKVFSKIDILPPGTICTETYLVVGCFDTPKEAENLVSYMRTKFFRFLVSQRMFSHHITAAAYSFVPALDMHIAWTDKMLFPRYGIDDSEVEFISRTIKAY